MTYIKAFENVKEKLTAVTAEKFTKDFAIQVNLVNKDCAGAFYIANLNGEFSVEPYDYKDNSAMITLMLGDFTKLLEGKLVIEKAIASGKLEIQGDIEAVEQILGIVEPQEKEVKKAAPKKKAPAKKAAVKKEEKKTAAKKEEKKAPAKKTSAKKETK